MSNLNVSHEQIKQLAMDWYQPIIAEIKAEAESPREVPEYKIQDTCKETNTENS